MWNNNEMSQLNVALTRVSLTLTSDLEFSRSRCISGGPIVMELLGRESLMWNTKEMSQLDAALTGVPLTLIFDLEFSRSNCNSGMGGPIVIMVMERMGRESIGWPIVMEWKGQKPIGHNTHYVTSRQRILLGTGWLKMSAFPSTRLVFHI